MPDAPRRSLCELARHSGRRAAARLRAGAPTFGAQTLVAIPLTMTLSIPRERRMSSDSRLGPCSPQCNVGRARDPEWTLGECRRSAADAPRFVCGGDRRR